MIKSVTIPLHIFKGIVPNHRAYPLPKNLRLFGADTETEYGRPMTVQLYDGKDELFQYVTHKDIFEVFCDYLFTRARTGGVNICYMHKLSFDAPILFYEKRRTMYEQVSEIKFAYKGFKIEMLFGRINKITIRRGKTKVDVLDSRAFTQTTFDRSLKMAGITLRKLPKPNGIGTVRYDTLPVDHPDRVAFEAYAKRDVRGQYALGQWIMGIHRRYKVRPSISLPQFGARVFRHHFMSREDHIPFPPVDIEKAARLSYHGGKNGFYLDGPKIVEDAYEVDISSAYPHAMARLPQFMRGDWGKVDRYDRSKTGVYKVSGEDKGKFPVVFDHRFKAVRGAFEDIWITGFELDCAYRSPGCRIDKVEGHVWVPDPRCKRSPLKDFCEHFYKMKQETPKDDPSYYFYKICLNSLYGKFLQVTELRRLVPQTDRDMTKDEAAKVLKHLEAQIPGQLDYVWDRALNQFIRIEKEFRAGGLYNPFIATQITGFVRKMMFELESENDAFHSATDAVKTTKYVPAIPGLGGLKVETFGRCYTFRNKLYLHFAKSSRYCGHKTPPYHYRKDHLVSSKRGKPLVDPDGQHLCKIGMHGFKGPIDVLFDARHRLIKAGRLEYSYQHMTGLREGMRSGDAVCSMTTRREVLRLAPVDARL